MNGNEKLIHDLYSAFQARDGEAMSALYHADALFSDPAFGSLNGREVGAMWRMLCRRGRDLQVTFDRVWADGERGSAHWEARYSFSSTGRKVHNVIEASFLFLDGKILEHHDRFDLWRWSAQALGPTGLLLGWTPLVRGRIRKQARDGLAAFLQKESV